MLSFIQHFEPLNWIYYVSFLPFQNRRSTLKAYKKADIYIYIYEYLRTHQIVYYLIALSSHFISSNFLL